MWVSLSLYLSVTAPGSVPSPLPPRSAFALPFKRWYCLTKASVLGVIANMGIREKAVRTTTLSFIHSFCWPGMCYIRLCSPSPTDLQMIPSILFYVVKMGRHRIGILSAWHGWGGRKLPPLNWLGYQLIFFSCSSLLSLFILFSLWHIFLLSFISNAVELSHAQAARCQQRIQNNDARNDRRQDKLILNCLVFARVH